jgi:hypothetical protein
MTWYKQFQNKEREDSFETFSQWKDTENEGEIVINEDQLEFDLFGTALNDL